MASNTPNLNLLKKDPVTDGNDTFNIQTMLNENWDKIDAAVGEVREELGDIDFPLSDETNGTRSDVAASEKAVGLVMAEAEAAKTAGNERKQEVVDALIAKGVSASTSESWDSLIAKMAGIIKATGNATAADVLAGKTFSNGNSSNLIGTMPILTGIRKATGVAQWGDGALAVYPEKGYQKGGAGDGEIKVSLTELQKAEPELIASNFRADKSLFGLQGAIPIKRPDISSHINASTLSVGNYSGDGMEWVYLGVPKGHILEGVDWVRHPKAEVIKSSGSKLYAENTESYSMLNFQESDYVVVINRTGQFTFTPKSMIMIFDYASAQYGDGSGSGGSINNAMVRFTATNQSITIRATDWEVVSMLEFTNNGFVFKKRVTRLGNYTSSYSMFLRGFILLG